MNFSQAYREELRREAAKHRAPPREGVRPVGFVPSESGLIVVVDPAMLRTYMLDEDFTNFILAATAGMERGDCIVDLPRGGVGAFLFTEKPGRCVFVKEAGEDVVIDREVPRDAQ